MGGGGIRPFSVILFPINQHLGGKKLQDFPWNFSNSTYTLETEYGKAVIVEIESSHEIMGGSRTIFLPRLEPIEGEQIESSQGFEDFESAEAWLIYGQLMDLDTTDQLLETLDYCFTLLQKDPNPESHQKRIELIKTILITQDSVEHDTHVYQGKSKRSEQFHLDWDWNEDGSVSKAITDYGQITIIEERSKKAGRFKINHISHTAYIQHHSGIQEKSYPYFTFEDAEQWIIDRLIELDNPTGSEGDFDNLEFTLQICEKLMSEDANVMHLIRLKRISTDLGDILL